ncbi:AAA family ATPase [Companilactobacillus nodensis]|uniref:Nuclease SbcCD subunit C n=1 Tax=Companilactobacillus nodensis DSM 19682 = JCM 14932 = NBRC 107160 TaxID=1423775 RepID=A0A0R1KBI2_9LACO|nr:SMC family ATPase [Companilactobacillus nodensis]KRK80933.1 exonuclease SbcC [Companilactobacillus nodensis DSM 19682 = JCM 14932 = NBRC 107160]
MKPLQLELNYFGPYKDQKIDFTKFNDFPVFLISGKTGAGKTTIFDAMCFALFGGTSGNDRQAKQMRSDFAKVDNETSVKFRFEHQGKTYQIVRSPEQEVLKKRGEGTRTQPADVTLTIFDESGKAIDEYKKVNAVTTYIHNLLQLTREQFSEIVLLPQGQFRKFLMANSDDKEKVLRDIFGTSLYSNWASELKNKLKKQQQQNSDASKKLNTYQQQLTWDGLSEDEITSLNPQMAVDKQAEQEKVQLRQKTELKNQFDTAKSNLTAAQTAENNGKTLDKNYADLEILNKKLTNLEAESETIDNKRELVKTLDWIQTLESDARQLKSAQEQVKTGTDTVNKLTTEKQLLDQKLKQVEETVKSLGDQKNVAEQRKNEIITLTDKKTVYEQVAETESKLTKVQNKLADAKSADEQFTKQISALSDQQDQLSNSGERLPELLSLGAKLSDQQRDLNEILKQAKSVSEQHHKVETQTETIATKQKELDDQVVDYESLHNNYLKLDSDWASEQIALLSKKLIAGTPCPVCGSTEHPAPAPVNTITVTEEQVKKAKQASDDANTKLATVKTQLDSLQEQLVDSQTELKNDSEALKQSLHEKLAITYTDQSDLQTQLQDYQAKLDNQQKENDAQKSKVQHDKSLLEDVKKDLGTATADQKEQNQETSKIEHQVLQLQTQLKDQKNQLADNFDNLDELENYLNKIIQKQAEYEKNNESANKLLVETNNKISASNSSLNSEQRYVADAQAKVAQYHESLTSEMTQKWNKPDFEQLNNLLSELSKLSSLRTDINNFEQQKSELSGQITTTKKNIADKPRPDLSVLSEATTAAQAKVNELETKYYDLDSLIKDNNKLVKQMTELLAQVKEQQTALAELQQLSSVTNGNGAQKLSLERFVLQTYLQKVLVLGNSRLQQLTNGRYQFQLDESVGTHRNGTGLEINVYDDNAGKIRSVHTLSGGESFIAALSLALALAEVIQNQSGGIKIDALFIDEGFGSLDEDALSMAMEALQTVEGQSRMIGIISHVRELEDQLPAQLQVTPNGDGTSKIGYQLELK